LTVTTGVAGVVGVVVTAVVVDGAVVTAVLAAVALVPAAFEDPPQPATASVVAKSAREARAVCNIVPSE
jgi:hypothetical protein